MPHARNRAVRSIVFMSSPYSTTKPRGREYSISRRRSRPMRRMLTIAAVAMLAGTIGLHADDKTGARWFAHIEALANDGMEGRNTGSPAHKRAAEYVAAQFQKAGLEPAGVGGYVQPVKLKTRKIVEAQSSLALVTNGKSEPLTLGEDANINLRVDPAPSLDAPLVFAGYGLNIPERS